MNKYKCPKCQMEFKENGNCHMDGTKLIKINNNHKNQNEHKKNLHHQEHHKMMMEDFKKRFIISSLVTLPVLILSPLVQKILGYSISFFLGKFILFGLSSFIFFWGGLPFLKGIYKEFRERLPGMMTLIAMAISVAYFYSGAVIFGLKGKYFFWELATLIDVMLLGHWIEMKSIMGASKAIEKLVELMPDSAHIVKNGMITDVKIEEVKKGDTLLIKAGEKIPSDGIIIKGASYIDESMLTGESKPIRKNIGDKVIGGSINGDEILEIKVTGVGKDSYLKKVIDLVKQAQRAKSKTEKFSNLAARWLTVIAITAGTCTFFYWFIYGPDLAFAIERLATVMVITCPHALGLAIPLVNAVSTSISAKNGLLIKNRTAFEKSRKITTVVFDKTGTLTEGNFSISFIKSFDKTYSSEYILQLAASLEKNSEHPIAKGIIKKAKEKNIKLLNVEDFKVLKGEGIEGILNGMKIQLISKKAVERMGLYLSEKLNIDSIATTVFVVIKNQLAGVITLEDKIREESYEAIKMLKKQNIKCFMLTGDNTETAKKVSDKLQLDGFFAEVLPHEKQEKIKELKESGEFVAMTGDGINDAPALALADVGIAIGSGTDIAVETADIVLVNSNPKDVVSLILFGKATFRKMVQNLLWATGYNILAIPLAAGILYNYGILISPAIGAALMSLSTIVVSINARLLKL